jgi:predicted RND superfamily exporter protein
MTIAGAYGAFHLGADFSIDILFLTEDEESVFFDEFKERFEESARDIIVLLTGEGLFDQEALAMLERLTGKLEEID